MNPSFTVVQLQARVYSKLPSTQITNDINKHASTVRTDQSCEFANLNGYNIQVQALGRPLVNSLHHTFFSVARAVSATCKGKRPLHPSLRGDPLPTYLTACRRSPGPFASATGRVTGRAGIHFHCDQRERVLRLRNRSHRTAKPPHVYLLPSIPIEGAGS